MYGTTSATQDPWTSTYWVVDATVASSDTVVITRAADPGPGWEESERIREFKKAAAHCEALRRSWLMAFEPHPERARRRAARRQDPSPSHRFHWMSQRQRCPGMRSPIPGFDRA